MFDVVINFFHLLATAIWIGGAIYIQFILQPALRKIDPQQSAKLQGIIAKRFSVAAWSCIGILILTGILKTPEGLLFDLSTELGQTLFMKHLFIAGVIAVGLIILFAVVPRMRSLAPKQGEDPSEEFRKAQKRLAFLASTNLIFGLIIIFLASQLW